MTKRFRFPAILVAALGACASDPRSVQIEQTVTVPARVQAQLDTATCTVATGPSVTLTGELALGGLQARFDLRNNVKGTHTNDQTVAATAVLLPADATVQITADALMSGMNPQISVQFFDDAGNPVSAEVILGTCASGPFPVTATVALQTTVVLSVSVDGCANHPGPTITLSGTARFAGLQARFIVRDVNNNDTIVGTATTNVDIVALGADQTLTIPKQPVHGGVGGNPLIALQLLDGNGDPLSDVISVGRCVQLSNGEPEDNDTDD